MIPLQLVSLIFGLYMLYWSFLSYKKRLFYIRELFFWIVVWSTFILVALFPDTTKLILQTFRINRVMDLLMILALIFLSIVTYRVYIDNRQLTKKLQDLVRQDAINKAKK